MLVSACRKIVSATSAVLCGFLFALRTYLCERPSSSFRPVLLLSTSCLFLFFFFFFLFFLLYLFFFPYHNRGECFYLGTLQMIRFGSINLQKVTVTTRVFGEFLLYAKLHSNVQIYFCASRRGNFASYFLKGICPVLLLFKLYIHDLPLPQKILEKIAITHN